MAEAIGQILGLAVGVAISPVPIIAVTLMLFSRSAASNSLSFLVGWLIGITGVATVVLAIGLDDSDGSDSGGIAQIVVGLLLLAVALQQWRSRPGDGDEPRVPPWMATIDELTAPKAFGLAVVLSALNPKNLGLTVAAAVSIGSVGLGAGQEAVVVLVYVVLASVTLIVPVVGYAAARDAMVPALDTMKVWLMANDATVMATLFLVLGAKVLGDGIASTAT